MFLPKRYFPVLFSVCLHGAIVGVLLVFSLQGTPIQEAVYHVALADFAPAAGPVSSLPEPVQPAPQQKAPASVPEPAKPRPPEPVITEKKVISAKKKKEPEKVQAKPAEPVPPPVAEAPSNSAAAQPDSPTEPGNAGGQGGAGMQRVGGLAAYDADRVDQRPAIARKVTPDYPVKARRMDVQGQVVVRLVVDTSGQPRSCAVHAANPQGYFEDAAIAAAEKTRFVPGKIKGQAVNTVVLLPFAFMLR